MTYQLGGIFDDALSSAIMAMLVACLLPFVWAVIAKVLGGFKASDNLDPRAFLTNTTGIASRSHAVQMNSFESLPMFLAAVMIAIYCFVPQQVVNSLAWVYVAMRVGFGVAYMTNLAALRSSLWALSMLCVVMLFVLAAKMVT